MGVGRGSLLTVVLVLDAPKGLGMAEPCRCGWREAGPGEGGVVTCSCKEVLDAWREGREDEEPFLAAEGLARCWADLPRDRSSSPAGEEHREVAGEELVLLARLPLRLPRPNPPTGPSSPGEEQREPPGEELQLVGREPRPRGVLTCGCRRRDPATLRVRGRPSSWGEVWGEEAREEPGDTVGEEGRARREGEVRKFSWLRDLVRGARGPWGTVGATVDVGRPGRWGGRKRVTTLPGPPDPPPGPWLRRRCSRPLSPLRSGASCTSGM